MTKQMTKIQQALLILLDAGFNHKEVARLFGITEVQVQDLCSNDGEHGDRELTAKRNERHGDVSILAEVNPFRPHRSALRRKQY